MDEQIGGISMERNERNQDPEVQAIDKPEETPDAPTPMIQQIMQTDVYQDIYRKYRHLFYE